MADDHMDVPDEPERSVITKSSTYYDYTKDWDSGSKPWPCQAHHILPGACFSIGNILCDPKDKKFYIIRCLLVSKWNLNGGSRHEGLQGGEGANNMVRLPTSRAYKKTYAATLAKFKKGHPVNECMHGWGGWSEHYLYNKEVTQWLNDNIWSTLQEDKVKHKGKGKDILSQLKGGQDHFRGELVRRGSRTTPKGNSGTIDCWLDKKDKNRSLPFSMANDKGMPFGTKTPT